MKKNLTELVFILDRNGFITDQESAQFGINEDQAAHYHADSKGTNVIYKTPGILMMHRLTAI